MSPHSDADVRMRGFRRLTPVSEALTMFLGQLQIMRLAAETLPTPKALGRALAEDIICERDVPPFDRSAVDGFAVRAEDTYGCSRTNPVVMRVVGSSSVGTLPFATLQKQQAVRIATGAPIPSGADAVVMLEYTEVTQKEKIEVYHPVTPGENISMQGEDVRRGDLILRSGKVVRPQDIGILAALGVRDVKVTRRPKVGVVSTGDELVDLNEEPTEGRIFDSNRPAITAMIISTGGEPFDLGIAADEEAGIAAKLRTGLNCCDIVCVSGGSSVGERDLIPSIVNSLGNPGVIVHGVAMRPGRPVALAAIDGKPVIMLPGFPVAAMIAFDVFVRPVIDRMLGVSSSLPPPVVRARSLRRVPSSLGNRTFARVIVRKSGGEYVFEPLTTSGSGVISTMVKANGLVVIPENKEGVEEGETLEVTLIQPVEM